MTEQKAGSGAWRMGAKRNEEKRGSARIRHGEAARAYNVDRIDARICTEQRSYEGSLLDLSAGGLSILTQAALPLNLPVAVELTVGGRQLQAHGLVKNRSKLGGRYRLGVQFTRLEREQEAFLQLLYGAGGDYEEVDNLPGE